MAAAAIAASIAGLLNDFVYDDVPLIRDNVRVHGLSHWGELFTRAYWPPPFIEQLYRPAASLLVALEYAAGGGRPIAFRVVSYALYAVCAVLVYRLAIRLLPRTAALCVAILFAVHPVHVEAVALGVNQGELLITLCAVAMTILYVDARRRGGPTARTWVSLASFYALAALSKESGLVLPLLLLAAEAVVVERPAHESRRGGLLPGFLALGIVALCVLGLRALVLGGAVGAVPARALRDLGLGGRLLMMLQVIPIWLRLFAWPAHLQADYAPSEIVAPSGIGLAEVGGLAIIAVVVGAFILTWRRAPVVCFALAWCIVGLLPVSNIIPSGVVVAERTLLLPSVGFLLAVGALGEVAAKASPRNETTVRRAMAAVFIVLTALGIARSAGRHRVWNSAHLRIVTPAERTKNL